MKTPEMENVLDSLAKAMFGRGRQDSMGASICVSCGSKVVLAVDRSLQLVDGAIPFRDVLSLKEYGISGLCQCCQDGVFGPHNDWDEDDLEGELYDSLDDIPEADGLDGR